MIYIDPKEFYKRYEIYEHQDSLTYRLYVYNKDKSIQDIIEIQSNGDNYANDIAHLLECKIRNKTRRICTRKR